MNSAGKIGGESTSNSVNMHGVCPCDLLSALIADMTCSLGAIDLLSALLSRDLFESRCGVRPIPTSLALISWSFVMDSEMSTFLTFTSTTGFPVMLLIGEGICKLDLGVGVRPWMARRKDDRTSICSIVVQRRWYTAEGKRDRRHRKLTTQSPYYAWVTWNVRSCPWELETPHIIFLPEYLSPRCHYQCPALRREVEPVDEYRSHNAECQFIEVVWSERLKCLLCRG